MKENKHQTCIQFHLNYFENIYYSGGEIKKNLKITKQIQIKLKIRFKN